MLKCTDENIITKTDSYKITHHKMYPEGTQKVYSYFESRVGAEYPETIFFGLQYLLKRFMVGKVVEQRDIDIAASLAAVHFGDPTLFNREGWEHILRDHKGKLPLRIKAVAEGTAVPTGNVLMTVENTCDKCFWLTNAMESLLTHVWAPSTVATISRYILKMIGKYVTETGGDMSMVPFQLQDFGYRGASSDESAAIAGAGHLVNGLGTDTLPAMMLLMTYYSAEMEGIGYSVPATEHSVMTALGEKGEMTVVQNLLDKYPKGILSVVADSYDIYAFVDRLGEEPFRKQIMERDGKLVIRPDSGNAVDTMVKLSRKLWSIFGGTTNEAGYKVFDLHVGLLWGDGIGPHDIEEILVACEGVGFCASNYVLGMGGGLLQKINRDMQRFAFKASSIMIYDEWHDMFKDPLDHSKASKRGRFQLEKTKGRFYTTQLLGKGQADSGANLLKTVFLDGDMVNTYTLDEVRENARK